MKIIVAGLGRMGIQIVRKLAESDHQVIAHNRSRGPIDQVAANGALAAYSKQQAVKAFGRSQIVLWLMLPAEIVEEQIEQWLELIPKNSILIDGGNSDYRHTRRRAQKVTSRGHMMLDVGTSGGVWGYQRGFSMMVGGEERAFKPIEPILQTLSKPKGGYRYFGPGGAGHFVKMVHNAIEYGMMESLAEGYRLLKEGPYQDLSLAGAAEVWQQGSVIDSWLNELCRQIFTDNPELKGIEGQVAESGEARWALETARQLKIPMPAIESAFNVRLESQKGRISFATKVLAAMRHKFGGHDINPKRLP